MTGQKPSLRGYLRWEAAYVVLRERGEPMTTAELVEEFLVRGQLFFGQFPETSLHQSLKRSDGGCLAFRDRRWSIVKEVEIRPPDNWD